MSKKLYIAMRPVPWERLNMLTGEVDENGEKKVVTGKGDHFTAGFLPIYWSKEAAEQANPGAQIQEGEVADEWWERPPAPNPQGDQVKEKVVMFGEEDIDALDKKSLIKLVKKAEDEFASRELGNLVPAIRGAVLGDKGPAKANKNKLKSYVAALHKTASVMW